MPRTPQTRVPPSPKPSTSLGDGLDGVGSIGDDIDFAAMLDDLGGNDMLDIDIRAQPAFSWDDLNLSTPGQFESPHEPVLEMSDIPSNDTGDILPGQFKPPWTPGHFLHSRYYPQEPLGARPTVASLTERLMIMALRSYPNMMQPDGVPPFIHPTHSGHEDMKATLENCVSLALLWKSQKNFNKRFVKESIGREGQRLLNEVCLSLQLNAMVF